MVNVSALVSGFVHFDRMSGLLSTWSFDHWGNSSVAWGVRGENVSSIALGAGEEGSGEGGLGRDRAGAQLTVVPR